MFLLKIAQKYSLTLNKDSPFYKTNIFLIAFFLEHFFFFFFFIFFFFFFFLIYGCVGSSFLCEGFL